MRNRGKKDLNTAHTFFLSSFILVFVIVSFYLTGIQSVHTSYRAFLVFHKIWSILPFFIDCACSVKQSVYTPLITPSTPKISKKQSEDGQPDGRTDKVSYRFALLLWKKHSDFFFLGSENYYPGQNYGDPISHLHFSS